MLNLNMNFKSTTYTQGVTITPEFMAEVSSLGQFCELVLYYYKGDGCHYADDEGFFDWMTETSEVYFPEFDNWENWLCRNRLC